jgi:hypothetical protein
MKMGKTMLMYEADDWCELVVDGGKKGNHSINYRWLADLPIEFPLTIISVYDKCCDVVDMEKTIDYFLENNDVPSDIKENEDMNYEKIICEDWREMLRNL